MTVSTFLQPNYTTQSASAYKAAIDAAIAVLMRQAGWFAPHQQDVGSPAPELSMRVDAGMLWDGTTLTEVAAQTVAGFTVPASGYVRIDRVVVDATTGVATRVAGTAETVGSPTAVAPAIPAGKLPVCQIAFTSSTTAVLNSMITDERVLLTSQSGAITLGTEQASTSDTAIDFTGIPASAKEITINLVGVSTGSTSAYWLQLGDSGGIETSGYVSAAANSGGAGATSQTSAFEIVNSVGAATTYTGAITLTLEDSSDNTWVCRSQIGSSGPGVFWCAGSKATSGTLDRVRITTASGDTFDAGVINISYR